MTRRPHWRSFSVAVLLVTACTSGGGSPARASLDGHTYLSMEVRGAELVQGTQVRLSFSDGNLNANAGCNIMGGTYTVDGGRLRTVQLAMTEMACDEARARQDEWLARYLGEVAYSVEGDTLTLDDGSIRVTLLDEEVANPDQAIEGTNWVLDGIISGDAVASVPAGVSASIRISNGQIDVDAGCNRGSGPVEVSADMLTFGPLMTTKMACQQGPASVESAVLTVLTGQARYTIDADTLTLSNGGAGLTFRAAP